MIKKYVDNINEELHDAQKYAEKYVEWKSRNNSTYAQKYHKLSEDEVSHAMFIHDVATAEIEQLKSVYKPPEDMLQKWEDEHKNYVDKVAWIKQMLAM